MSSPRGVRSTLSGAARGAENGIGTERGGLIVFAAALGVYAFDSIGLPVVPGRDFGTYLQFYAQIGDWHSVFPMSMLYRTPVAPLVVGAPLDLAGGWGLQVVMALLYAGSIHLWVRAALCFGRRAALLTAVALLLYPGFSILFHRPASDPVTGAVFAFWGFLLARAVVQPAVWRFGALGVVTAVAALVRPGNQVLIAFVVVPLLVRQPWRTRVAAAAVFLTTAVLVLGGWALNNGIRYDDYAVARGGKAYLPFFRAFTKDHIVEPDNGSASRKLAAVVQGQLLTQEPYRSYGVTLQTFFARGNDREFEDLIGISDRVWGWDSDYSMLRRVGVEAVRAHPGAYARGVTSTVLRELWHPLFIALPSATEGRAGPSSPSAALAPDNVVIRGRRVPRPSGGETIPAAHQGFYSTTPDGHIREVWTSPTRHDVVFDDPGDKRRYEDVRATVDRLAADVPPYSGSAWLTLQLSRSSKLFPPPLLWLVLGVVALFVRRPARAPLALALAAGALLVTVFNALTIYPIIEFAIPLMPALIVCGAAGLVGDRGDQHGR